MGFDGGSSSQLHLAAGGQIISVEGLEGVPVAMALEPR